MRAVIQRVSEAKVTINGQIAGQIQHGLLILLGIHTEDSQADADYLLSKITQMRIFNDADGKMNIGIKEINGEVLVISQFTLFASTIKGNRPSFIQAARPESAVPLYEYFLNEIETLLGKAPARGVFGADMKVALVNDGPVTIVIDSKERQ